MAKVQILYWQEIPSLVEARDDAGVKKIQLSQRFQALIDHAAMLRKMAGTDGYLEQWNKGKAEERDGSAEQIVQQVAEEIENRFSEIKDAAVKVS